MRRCGRSSFRVLIWACFSLFFPVLLAAQPVPIFGIVNVAAPVLSIDSSCSRPRLKVSSATGFFPGSKAILLQVKGAAISLNNVSDFGTITNLRSSGLFEIVRIQSVTDSSIDLTCSLVNRYDTDGKVQLVAFPAYRSAAIAGLVSANPWNGSSGGVIAFDVADTLFLSGEIDASGAGFRGGDKSVNQPTFTVREYAYPHSSAKGGAKGEGIANTPAGLDAGRGPLANGGGGGNAVNTGGGGGANRNSGGRGGLQYIGSGPDSVMGIGGYPIRLQTTDRRIFFGGGGGGGHQNDGTATTGASGGGIVIIRARHIVLSGNSSIRCNGWDAGRAGNDGAGGGGAGGTVVIVADTVTGIISGILAAEARGGKGGDVTNTYTQGHCHGPGGGGSGGCIILNKASHLPSITMSASRGEAGRIVSTNTPCAGTTWGAEAGSDGFVLADYELPENTIIASVLSVTAGPAASVCRDSCTVISAQAHGGRGPYRFHWWPETGIANPYDSITAACPKTTTTYTATVTDSRGCQSSSTVTITVFPAPPQPVITRSKDTLMVSPALSYQWYRNGVLLPGEIGRKLIPGEGGLYTVRMIDVNGCPSESDTVLFDFSATSATVGIGCSDTLFHDPGEVIQIPIMIRDVGPGQRVEASQMTVRLHFDKNVLQPVPGPGMMFADSGRVRFVECRRDLPSGLTPGTVLELPLLVTLGDTACTEIVLDSAAVATNSNLALTLDSTACRVCVNVCREGGQRLYLAGPSFLLKQNHPNPFNAITWIEYRLPYSARVRMDVYDTRGAVVSALVDADQESGSYRVLFDAGHLSSGIYAAVLRVDSMVEVIHLSVVK